MKKYCVMKRSTEFNSYKDARKAYEGITLDSEINRGNTSADEIHEFTNEADARAFLNQKENYYCYNGSGFGYAEEWTLEEYDVDEDGYEEDSGYFDMCPNSNLSEFLKRING